MKLNKKILIIIAIIILIIINFVLFYFLKFKNKTIVDSIAQTTTISPEQKKLNNHTTGEFAVIDDGDIMTVTNTYGNTVINSIDSNEITNYNIANKTTSYTVNTNKGNANVASTEPYIPDGMQVADPNDNSGIKASDIKFNRKPENVTIEVLKDTITNASVEILITDNNEDKYGWGVQFAVQEKVNGEWKDLEYISDDIAWISIAYVLDENNQLKQKLDIENYYGKLPKGIYRIVKSQWDEEKYIDLYSNEFEVK